MLLTAGAFVFAVYLGKTLSENIPEALVLLFLPIFLWLAVKQPEYGLLASASLLILIPPWFTLINFGIPIVQLDPLRILAIFFLSIMFARVCMRKIKGLVFSPLDTLLIVLTIYSIISCIGFWTEETMRGVLERLIIPLLFFFGVKILPIERKHVNIMEVTLVLAGLSLAVVMLVEYFFLQEPLFIKPALTAYQWVANEYSLFRAGGMTGGAPESGLILVMVVFMAYGLYISASGLKKIVYLLFITAITTAIIITFTRAVWLGLFVGISIYFMLCDKHKKYFIFFGLLGLAGLFWICDLDYSGEIIQKGVIRLNTMGSRFVFWQEIMSIYTSSLKTVIFGIGYTGSRTFDVVGSALLVGVGSHCYYLTMLLETGLIGLTIYLTIAFLIFTTARRNILSADIRDTSTRKYALLLSSVSALYSANLFGEYSKGKHSAILWMVLLSLLVNRADLFITRKNKKIPAYGTQPLQHTGPGQNSSSCFEPAGPDSQDD